MIILTIKYIAVDFDEAAARHIFRGGGRKADLHRKERLFHKTDIPVWDNLTASTAPGSGFVVHYCQNMKQLEFTNVNHNQILQR